MVTEIGLKLGKKKTHTQETNSQKKQQRKQKAKKDFSICKIDLRCLPFTSHSRLFMTSTIQCILNILHLDIETDTLLHCVHCK